MTDQDTKGAIVALLSRLDAAAAGRVYVRAVARFAALLPAWPGHESAAETHAARAAAYAAQGRWAEALEWVRRAVFWRTVFREGQDTAAPANETAAQLADIRTEVHLAEAEANARRVAVAWALDELRSAPTDETGMTIAAAVRDRAVDILERAFGRETPA